MYSDGIYGGGGGGGGGTGYSYDMSQELNISGDFCVSQIKFYSTF